MDPHDYLLSHLCLAKETVVDFEDPRVSFALVSKYHNAVFTVNMTAF
jgi:hypothetical protein